MVALAQAFLGKCCQNCFAFAKQGNMVQVPMVLGLSTRWGFSKSLGRCTALTFCGFCFALGKRVAHVWGRVAKGWRWVVCFGGFDCVSTRGTLQSPWGAARRRGQKSLAGFRGSANAWHCGGARKGALQTAFFHMAKAIQSNNRRIKICGTKFKEKKNK